MQKPCHDDDDDVKMTCDQAWHMSKKGQMPPSCNDHYTMTTCDQGSYAHKQMFLCEFLSIFIPEGYSCMNGWMDE